ncbi:hypothetical protein [Methanothrix sp.]|jgi:hypothetical protein|uniref:hypothetical protein n=1 Tax=Methanothrix sp. TaxID=90426 RepID=UPI003296D083
MSEQKGEEDRMQKTNPYMVKDQSEEVKALPPDILEAYLEVTQCHHKLLARLAQR